MALGLVCDRPAETEFVPQRDFIFCYFWKCCGKLDPRRTHNLETFKYDDGHVEGEGEGGARGAGEGGG